MADQQPIHPVTPAAGIAKDPAQALDGITNKEPGLLDQARETMKPVSEVL